MAEVLIGSKMIVCNLEVDKERQIDYSIEVGSEVSMYTFFIILAGLIVISPRFRGYLLLITIGAVCVSFNFIFNVPESKTYTNDIPVNDPLTKDAQDYLANRVKEIETLQAKQALTKEIEKTKSLAKYSDSDLKYMGLAKRS